MLAGQRYTEARASLLDMTVDRVARLPVLLLITFRPEFVPPWTGQAHLTTLSSIALASGSPSAVGPMVYCTSLGQLERAEGIGAELCEIARKNDSPDGLLQAHHAAFPVPWLRGALPEANTHIEALLALYVEAKHDQHRYVDWT